MVTGQRSLVNGQWSTVNDQWSMVNWLLKLQLFIFEKNSSGKAG